MVSASRPVRPRVRRERDAGAPAPEAAPQSENQPLKCLSRHQIWAIDEALAMIGAFGEVTLVKNRGKLRFIEITRSEDLGAGDREPWAD